MTIPPLEPRITGMFRPAGTRSFRLACGEMFGRYGGNMQNPSKDTIDFHIARDGHSLVQPDQSGAEALVVAYLTRPGSYRDLFLAGIKPHTFLALHIFGEQRKGHWPYEIPLEEYLALPVTELAKAPGWKALDEAIKESDNDDDRPYYIGKKLAHGKSYDMGARTLQMSILKDSGGALALSLSTCSALLKTFERLFPEVIEWQDEIRLTVRARRELVNLQGYPRAFNRIFTDSYLREAISWIPQSTVGVITHKAIIAAQLYIEANRLPWNLLNNKHDSFLLEVPDDHVPQAARLSTEWMAQDLLGRDNTPFTMRSEVQVGKNWKPASPKNPAGMKKFKL